MNKKQAEDIYLVLTNKNSFSFFAYNNPDYEKLKRERVKIANRYMELKSECDFLEAEKIAIIEWLMNMQVDECPEKP